MAIEKYPRPLLELEERFATDEQCRGYLAALRRFHIKRSLAAQTTQNHHR